MSKPKLTEADFERAAARLRCEVAAIKAVAEVESRGEGFYADGFPVILFERHKFYKYAKRSVRQNWQQYADICNPDAGGYGKPGQNQRNKFSRAFALDAQAAMKSCSWGKFQIMGFNHAICGFDTVDAFVDAMKESEGKHLDAFVGFVAANGLADELRRKDWTGFASRYNGPAYKKNKYDTKMAAAYKRFASKPSAAAQTGGTEAHAANIGQTEASSSPASVNQPAGNHAEPPPIEITKKHESETDGQKESIEVTAKNEQDVNTPAPVTAPEPYLGIGFWAVIKRDLTAATGGNLTFSGLSEYAQQASGWPEWVVALIGKIAVGALIVTLGYFVFRVVHYLVDTWKKGHKTRTEAMVNTDITRRNIEWQ